MNLGMLGAVGPGYLQGQDALGRLRAQAQSIQQNQMALDQAKRELQAQAAAFAGLAQMQQGGGQTQNPAGPAFPQPPAPGQPSQPMTAPGSPPPQPGMPPSPAAGGPSAPPMGGGGMDPSMQGQDAIIMQVAQAIKKANPQIDDATLFEAVKLRLGLMGNLAAAQKPQIAMYDTAQRVAATERGQDMNYDARIAAIKERAQETSAHIQAGMDRARYLQGEIDSRFKDKSISDSQRVARSDRVRMITGQLNAAKSTLDALINAGTDPSDPRYQQAQKQVDDAMGKLDILSNAMGLPGGSDSSGGGGGEVDQGNAGSRSSPPTNTKGPTAPGSKPTQATNELPLPSAMQNLKEGESVQADDGSTWVRRGAKLVRKLSAKKPLPKAA